MSYNILVVDDSPVARKMVKKTIDMTGLDVGTIHEAGNGQEALTILADQWIDIVFADLHMPQMNGIEMVESMRRDQLLNKVPVVIVSSDRSQTQMDMLRERGVRAYVTKPFKPERIREIVADVLGGAEGGRDHAG